MKYLATINAASPVSFEAPDANAAVDAARALCTTPGAHSVVVVEEQSGKSVSEFGLELPEPELKPAKDKGKVLA